MSALPSAVKKQIARASQLAEEALKAQQPPPAAAPAAPSAEVPPAAPAAAPAPAANASPTPSPAPQPNDESMEHKYRVLQGKYNAEVPRLTAQIREMSLNYQRLQDQLTSTQQLLASLGAQRTAAAEPSSGAPPASPTKLVKDEEIKEFGPDLYDFIRRTARESVLPEVDTRFEQKLRPVAQRVDQVAAAAGTTATQVKQEAEQKVLSLLTAQVPNWQQQDEDPGFLNWLDQVDPYSGAKRAELLVQAYKRHDGPRVVAFFKGYLNENAAVTPPAPSAAPAAATPAPQRSLEELVAPGTTKAGTAGAQEGAGKRIWTATDIKKFYHDVQTGKYRSRADEAKKIEQDIFNAQREGRIRP